MYKNIAIAVLALAVVLLGAYGWKLNQDHKALQTAINEQKAELGTLKAAIDPIKADYDKMQEMRKHFREGGQHMGPPPNWQGNSGTAVPPGVNQENDENGQRPARGQNGQRPFRRRGGNTGTTPEADAQDTQAPDNGQAPPEPPPEAPAETPAQ